MKQRALAFGTSLFIHLFFLTFFTLIFSSLQKHKPLVVEIDLTTYTPSQETSFQNTPTIRRIDTNTHKLQRNVEPADESKSSTAPNTLVEKSTQSEPEVKPIDVTEEKTTSQGFSSHETAKVKQEGTVASEPHSPTSSEKVLQKRETYDTQEQKHVSHQTIQELYLREKLSIISSILQKNASYPPLARRMGWEGKVVIAITIREDKSLENVEVVRSSGYDILDQNAIETVRRSYHLFPKPPVTVRVVVPITYKLE